MVGKDQTDIEEAQHPNKGFNGIAVKEGDVASPKPGSLVAREAPAKETTAIREGRASSPQLAAGQKCRTGGEGDR